FGLGDLHSALLADHSPVLHALVLATETFVVLDGTEDLRAEQPVTLRLERAVIDGLGLLHFPKGPFADHFRAGDGDLNGRKAQRIFRLIEEIKQIFHVYPYSKQLVSKIPFQSSLTSPEPQPVPR